MTLHDFDTDNTWSQSVTEDPLWLAFFRRAFRDAVTVSKVPPDCQAQRRGIDWWIGLGSGATLAIDAKLRREAYEDVALEYLSNDRTGALGWMEKDQAIDFIAYAWLPTRRCVLLPWQPLRRVWLANRREWFAQATRREQGFRLLDAHNAGRGAPYTTKSIAVPKEVLTRALARALVVDLGSDTDISTLPSQWQMRPVGEQLAIRWNRNAA